MNGDFGDRQSFDSFSSELNSPSFPEWFIQNLAREGISFLKGAGLSSTIGKNSRKGAVDPYSRIMAIMSLLK